MTSTFGTCTVVKKADQSNAGAILLKLGRTHLVLLLVRIAAFHAGERSLGQSGLHAHHGGGVLLGLSGESPSSSNTFCTCCR